MTDAPAKILVTPRSLTRDGHPELQRLEEAGFELLFCKPRVQPSEQDLLELVPGCAGYLAGVEEIGARVLQAAGKLRVISRNGVGIDNVDLAAAEKAGIKVMPARGTNARGVAELAIGLIFALVRSIPFSDACMKDGEWQRRKGTELKGRTLGLIGCGRIGSEVAGMASGLGLNVVVFDVQQDPASMLKYVSMDEVLATSDILSLHCPAQADGRPLIDSAAIAGMKKGVFLINTARHSLLDVQPVLAALDSGQISGLATDVFEKEPPGEDALVDHARVIATPHIGGFTDESISRSVAVAVDNLLEVLATS